MKFITKMLNSCTDQEVIEGLLDIIKYLYEDDGAIESLSVEGNKVSFTFIQPDYLDLSDLDEDKVEDSFQQELNTEKQTLYETLRFAFKQLVSAKGYPAKDKLLARFGADTVSLLAPFQYKSVLKAIDKMLNS